MPTADRHQEIAPCPRCKGEVLAEVGEPWQRPDGVWEWVTIQPHRHTTTLRSTCRPRGYARRAEAAVSH